jgi:hypothetical protein
MVTASEVLKYPGIARALASIPPGRVPEAGWVFWSTLIAWALSRKFFPERLQRFKAALSYALLGGVVIALGLLVAVLVHPIVVSEQAGEIVGYTFVVWVFSRLFPLRLKTFVNDVFMGELVFIGLILAVFWIELAIVSLTG